MFFNGPKLQIQPALHSIPLPVVTEMKSENTDVNLILPFTENSYTILIIVDVYKNKFFNLNILYNINVLKIFDFE